MWCQWPVRHVEGSPFCSSVLSICVYVYNQIHAHTRCQWARSSHTDYFPQLLLPHNLLGVSNPCLVLLASHPTLPHISATLPPYWGKQENAEEEQMSFPLALRPQRLWQEGKFPFLCCGSSHHCSADPEGLPRAGTWEKKSRQAVFSTLSEPKLLPGFFLKLRRQRFLGLSICMQGSGLWAYQVQAAGIQSEAEGSLPEGATWILRFFSSISPLLFTFLNPQMAGPGICPGVLAPSVEETQGRVLTPTFLEPVLPALFSVVFCCFSTMGCSVCVCVCTLRFQ